MKAWRGVLIALSFLLLSGCLVTFKEPLAASDPAPKGLLNDAEPAAEAEMLGILTRYMHLVLASV